MTVASSGLAELYVDARGTQSLNVSGELWATPLRATARPDASRQELWSALVFGSEAMFELNEQEQMTLALKGRAVSPVTSYLAIEPGVRPSTEGLTEQESGRTVRAPRVRMGGTRTSSRAPHLDLQDFLTTRLRPELERCGGAAGDAYVDIETTRDEIVHVELTSNAGPLDPQLSACFTESTWALLLPSAFHEDFASFRVEL